MKAVENIRKRLLDLGDEKNRAFMCKLTPTLSPDRVIGVKVPVIREFAKTVEKEGLAEDFLKDLPHRYFEENMLHGVLVSRMRDYDRCVSEMNRFLPYVDNWAVCDSTRPNVFGKHLDRLEQDALRWMESKKEYTCRFGIEMFMNFFLDKAFKKEYLEWVLRVQSEEYYVKMMIAWYFATALAKQYEATLPVVESKRLSPWVQNKTVQKAVESYRLTAEQKAYLKSLKIPKA